MTEKRTYKVTIISPHGKQAIESWRHWMEKVADEAETRWGIQIEVSKQADEDTTGGG